ncbi:Brp/Blh family beta-carotene 15,15'-dioxygenase [Qipengyuania sp. G39]|uniref:Probable beta-carotene 15,15'-dioxygenase n=1 Tax=Qipengyuania profundimaris TaxID=3067652 RepID=A0ABT9HMH3_9SPHN|nr:Brp/Blh family beta-carotene 15,15'-dioxygenase [Qipengyuania sp. G39]MDP4574346.1 Brp/Blh family beta-carotene 15,15'-dioxygenase [Qipengyuania sp. G39]
MATRSISGSNRGSRLGAGAPYVFISLFAVAGLAQLAGSDLALAVGLALFVLGLGHGAGDENDGELRAYSLVLVAAYVVTGLAIAALYLAWPVLGLSIFLAFSAWHFARSDSGMDLLPRLAIAGLAVGGSALLRPETTATVFTAALGEAPPALLLLLLAVVGCAALLAAGGSIILRYAGAASAGLAALACLLFHPVLAVGLIFFGMHALPVQQRQVARYGPTQVIKAIALPTAVATLAAAAIALAVWSGWLALELAVALAFGMATPHMLTERLER